MPIWDTDYTEITAPADGDTALVHDVSEVTVGHKMKWITWANIKATLKTYLNTYFDTLYAINGGTNLVSLAPAAGTMLNGQISVTVATNNLTVALKGKNGNDPSASNPISIYIGGAWRTITAALLVTVNAAANTFKAGSSELATQEIDYFAYLRYNATDGICLGFSRIPFGAIYSDFSATATNEKYAAWNVITNAAAGDECFVIGRFAATLSAGAGYTWTSSSYSAPNAKNLIQRPIHETRLLAYIPTIANMGSVGTPTFSGLYVVILNKFTSIISITPTTSTTSSVGSTTSTMPFTPRAGCISGTNLFGVNSYGCYIDGTSNKVYLSAWTTYSFPLQINVDAFFQ